MYVWVVEWDNRPTEVYYGDKNWRDILEDDLEAMHFLEGDIEFSPMSFYVDDYVSGQLVQVK